MRFVFRRLARHFAFLGLFFLCLLVKPAAGVAGAACSCPLLPMEGLYGGLDDLRVTYSDGTAQQCPTAIRLDGRRFDAPDLKVELFCNPQSGIWSGVEATPFGEPFYYELTVAAMPAPDAPEDSDISGYGAAYTQTAGVSDRLHLYMKLPTKLKAMGKEDRIFDFTLKKDGRAAPCLCERVKEALDFVRRVGGIYGRSDILAQAQDGHMRSSDPRAKYWQDDRQRLHEFGQQVEALTYESLISAAVSGNAPAPQAVQGGGRIKQGSLDEVGEGAAADTHPITCKITMPKPDAVKAECLPVPVLEGYQIHERVHQKRCEKMRESSVYILPDGKRVNWVEDRDAMGGVYVDGKAYPTSGGYPLWSENPANHALDEQEAYAAEAAHLEAWLGAYCK